MTTRTSSLSKRFAGVAIAAVLGCQAGSCEGVDRETVAQTCDPGLGCMNARFISAVETKCGSRTECTLSIHDVFPDIENVYIVQSGAARLDECTTIPISPSIRKTYYPLCQYVLLQEHGQVSSYLRGHCVDVRVTGDELDVDPTHIGNVSVIDPRTGIRVSTVREEDSQGRVSVFRNLSPPRGSLVPFTADRCVGR
jgi:hypothetical protein